jgi:hypothetical protein
MTLSEEFEKETKKESELQDLTFGTWGYSQDYVEWLEAKINYTRCCTELPNECGLLKNINGCDKGSGCRYPNCV